MASEVQIRVGDVLIGGGAPVVVQSMTLTKTHDVSATTAQIAALASAGCEAALDGLFLGALRQVELNDDDAVGHGRASVCCAS